MSLPAYRDGNALAGPLSQIFAVDPTTAWRRCPECGLTGSLAQLRVYGPDPGLTGRCPGCDTLALRVVEQPRHLWLQMGGGQGAFRFTRL
ncbi:DUF6510 family protein [Streptomyces sp. NE06-03E]|uniref:Uncharacterized protein n=1 Tax=Streptomyces sp. gb1(2016) TaxID=1828321 RepID=A0A652LCP0_9ACTN|nr:MULTISPECIES: DUF6510 family protein [unclassified Streptomyces]MDX3056232.1 DUF6510 family protein [Streptomyces sp. NE06-03E]TXS32948.1 hypothetical protein EAO74_05130 [Streptomyces sp. gb1(2016)]